MAFWQPTPKQAEFMSRGEFEVLFGGASGPGKGQILDDLILTPFGWEKMGNIKIGDFVCSARGNITRVIGVYPLGKQRVNKVIFEDDSFCYVTDEHIWCAWEAGRPRKNNGKRIGGIKSSRLYLTEQLRQMINRGRKMVIPVNYPVRFTVIKRNCLREIDPYTLGACLGDCSFSIDNVKICTPDREIIEQIIQSNNGDTCQPIYYERNHCFEVRFKNSSKFVGFLKNNNLLGKHADEKFIPKEYLWSPLDMRIRLLQGLLDTDGYANEDGIEFSTTSKQLAEDVIFLVMSLGGVATLSEKDNPRYIYNGEARTGQKAYRIRIKFLDFSNVFTVKRKGEKTKKPQFILRRIKSIEPVHNEDAQCIKISDPSGLYITNNFIVTHNTDALIMLALRYVHKPKYSAVLFRRNYPQAQEIIDRTRRYYPVVDPGAMWREKEHRWYFSSGATINIGHMQYEQDRFNYHGHEYHFIGFDELTQFTEEQYLYMFSRARSTDPEIRPMVRATSNPGGIGHRWVKDRFVTITEPGKTYIDPETGFSRCFIPAKLTDNPHLLENDPGYIQRLMLLPTNDRMRYLEGIWDTFEGQVFTELNRNVHGIEPFDIPPEWPRYRSFDWGYSAPFAVLWWACDYDGVVYLYREWYGAKYDEEKRLMKGLRMTATDIARGIKEIEEKAGDRGVRPGPADPSIWNKRRDKKTGAIGRSVADEMAEEGILWIPADNNRILGKQQFHTRLRLDEEGHPHIYIFNDCEHFWRTISVLREDPKNPEDVDTDQEDHVFDAVKYFLMFQPMRAQAPKRQDINSFQKERQKYIRAVQFARRYGTSLDNAYMRVR